jgi:hypothetical protein
MSDFTTDQREFINIAIEEFPNQGLIPTQHWMQRLIGAAKKREDLVVAETGRRLTMAEQAYLDNGFDTEAKYILKQWQDWREIPGLGIATSEAVTYLVFPSGRSNDLAHIGVIIPTWKEGE